MENYQRKLISDNKVLLIESIQCTTMLLTRLTQEGIFSQNDIEDIKCCKTPLEQAAKLLEIIEQRKSSFEKLVLALELEKQTGAVEILKLGLASNVNDTQDQKYEMKIFSNNLQELQCLLDIENNSTNVLLKSYDPEIAIQRIKDAVLPDKIEFFHTNSLTQTEPLVEEMLKLDLKGFYGQYRNHHILIIPIKLYQILKCLPGWNVVEGCLNWKGFSKHGQALLLQREVQFQGRPWTLEQICDLITQFSGENRINLLNNLDSQFLIELHHDRKPELASGNIPNIPSHYVTRTLTYRSRISRRVLNVTKHSIRNDVFVFKSKGLRLYDLMSFVERRGDGDCDTSGNQIKQRVLSTTAILLETWSHFEKLCEKSYGRSIHLLECIRDNEGTGSIIELHWLRSVGPMDSIQNYIHSIQENFSETELYQNLNNSSTPICVSDSPGMGKSCLFSRCAHKLAETVASASTEIRLVLYVSFKVFIAKILTYDNYPQSFTQEPSQFPYWLEHEIINSFAHCSSKFELGKKLLTAILSPQTNSLKTGSPALIKLELFFDGIDELRPDHLPLAQRALSMFQKLSNNTRIWVTTRPHLLHYTECVLGVLGFTMQPFKQDDQANLLTNLWIENTLILYDEMREVANMCLHTLKTKVCSKSGIDDDIGGSPLLCQLLANIYKQDAQEECQQKNPNEFKRRLDKYTIFLLYDQYVNKKFQDDAIGPNMEREVRMHHIEKAMQICFPEVSVSGIFTNGNKMNDEDLLRYGILEADSVESPLRFTHSTFTEYFVAEGVKRIIEFLNDFDIANVECLENYADYMYKVELYIALIRKALSVEPFPLEVYLSDIITENFQLNALKFENDNICYFLNTVSLNLKASSVANLIGRFYSFDTYSLANNTWRCLLASTTANFCNIAIPMISILDTILPDSISKIEFFTRYPSNSFHDLIYLSVKFSSPNLIQGICEMNQRWPNLPLNAYIFRNIRLSFVSNNHPGQILTIVHAAMEAGNYLGLVYLLRKEGFLKLIKQDNFSFLFLLHFLLLDSIMDIAPVVERKKEILDLFASDIDLQKVIVDSNNADIILQQVHLDLLLHFCQIKRNLAKELGSLKDEITVNKHGENLLHLLGNSHYETNITAQRYHFALVQLKNIQPPINLQEYLEQKNWLDWRAVDIAVSYIDVLDETLDLFGELGITFDVSDFRGSTTLFKAVAGHRDENSLRKLLERNATWEPKIFKETIVHVAARYFNYPAVKLFLSLKKENATAENHDGNTPLHMCFRLEDRRLKLQEQGQNESLTDADLSPKPGLSVYKKFMKPRIKVNSKVSLKPNKMLIPTQFEIMLDPEPSNQHKIITLLIEYGAKIDKANKSGITPLHLALDICLGGLCEFHQKALLNEKENLFKKPSLLTLALQGLLLNTKIGYHWHPSLLFSFADQIKNLGGDVYWKNKSENASFLHQAARKHSFFGVKYLIETIHLSADLEDNFGNTPLKYMCCPDNCNAFNCSKIRQYLLAHSLKRNSI